MTSYTPNSDEVKKILMLLRDFVPKYHHDKIGSDWTPITTLSGGFLVTNWLVREQQLLRDVGFSVFCRFNSKPT